MEHEAFVERVLKRLPSSSPTTFSFKSWSHGGRPTREGVGIMPIAGLDPEKAIDAVFSVDDYVGNLDYVDACNSVADDRYKQPEKVRFYQRLKLPVIGRIHHELVLHRMGEMNGYLVGAWGLLRDETDKLSPKQAVRSDYNHGAWFAAPGVLGYALCSAPKRKDVGFLKWKALTTGADVAASKALRANLEGLSGWAARR